MARVRLDLPEKTFAALTELAVKERRPIDWQAEVLIETGLGLRNQAHDDRPPHRDDATRPLPVALEETPDDCAA